jgi:hypothetical protein
MNYKNIGLRDFEKFTGMFSKVENGYSLGETFYAVLRATKVRTINELMQKSDEEIATSINKALYEENEQ